MNILSIDTCFDACSAAAGRGLRSLTPAISCAFEAMQKGHAERLLPMVRTVMSEAKLEFAALDRIAVTYGPGTFTGTRICVSAARALALAAGAELVAISSLRLMAMSALIPAANTAHIAIATDARRGEIYLEVFDRHSLNTVVAAQCVEIGNAVQFLGSAPIVIAGSGAEALAHAARASGIDASALLPELLPDAFDMLFAAVELPVSATVRPLYLRPPDAKPPAPSPLIGAEA
ncbi:tRNA (adenosine(37)-N6)-threonylcarbamoyltransferase complex dimerization subunit type 1 TsaB [Hyphomicrobium sp.]|jgi:tRNA threonylcarbamoyladenosine biosynthesis protein TsaB|uniref:tRNA (adenosine(37)-N6)-threonylcarbamoyltransferase complex dimerization subunit type 1 TsaB n=1 Tax=Hyphomicrobium sp. TaxID=82 RepID=UPI002CC20714|nr:tRNA (adenosine(37)-N6)-threonylcarbamoyltransferase complex dimerization subunit type 1 TsaB [Hyphomicrobium sp.]HVZ05949.1 tRNA (adenosine(37)-N6)-threonylcarbamoyltransferase complex dimerization subunit type 1 TsaB [Hyphomicrobium sp.]